MIYIVECEIPDDLLELHYGVWKKDCYKIRIEADSLDQAWQKASTIVSYEVLNVREATRKEIQHIVRKRVREQERRELGI